MVAAIITYAHDKRRFNLTKTNLEYDGYDGTFLDLYKHNDLASLSAPEIVKEFFHDTGKWSKLWTHLVTKPDGLLSTITLRIYFKTLITWHGQRQIQLMMEQK